jgi:hypothetical protein
MVASYKTLTHMDNPGSPAPQEKFPRISQPFSQPPDSPAGALTASLFLPAARQPKNLHETIGLRPTLHTELNEKNAELNGKNDTKSFGNALGVRSKSAATYRSAGE